jgi:hypothetical protein
MTKKGEFSMNNVPPRSNSAGVCPSAKREWVRPQLQRLDSREATATEIPTVNDGVNCS